MARRTTHASRPAVHRPAGHRLQRSTAKAAPERLMAPQHPLTRRGLESWRETRTTATGRASRRSDWRRAQRHRSRPCRAEARRRCSRQCPRWRSGCGSDPVSPDNRDCKDRTEGTMPGCCSRRERHSGRPVERGRFPDCCGATAIRQPRGLGHAAAARSLRSSRQSGQECRFRAGWCLLVAREQLIACAMVRESPSPARRGGCRAKPSESHCPSDGGRRRPNIASIGASVPIEASHWAVLTSVIPPTN
jgi:hypothetical protein